MATAVTEPLRPDDNLSCEDCGRYGAIDFGERKLCPDCYQAGGSCCSEFSRKESDSVN